MVQLKMRPIFSRGNSVASISVAAPNKPDDDDADEHQHERQGGDDSNEREAHGRNASPQQQRRMQLRRRRRRLVNAHVSFSDTVTEHPAGEPLTEKELKAYFYSVRRRGEPCSEFLVRFFWHDPDERNSSSLGNFSLHPFLL
jgi:hypothetical protein